MTKYALSGTGARETRISRTPRLLSRVDFDLPADRGLASEDVSLRLIPFSKRVFHVHRHAARCELDAAGAARARAAGTVDEDAGVVGRVEDGCPGPDWSGGVRSPKDHLACQLG